MRRAFRLLQYARSDSGGVAALVAALSAGVAMDLLKPWPMKLIVDCVLGSRPLPDRAAWLAKLPGAASSSALLGWLTAATLLVFLAGWSIRLVQTRLETVVGNRMTYRLGNVLFDELQRLSLRYHHRRAAGDLMKRVITDASCIRTLVIGVIVPLLTSLVSLGSMFAVMWQLDSVLACAAIIAAPLLFGCVRFFSGPMEQRTMRQFEMQGEIMALSEQTLTALPVVRAFGREDHEDRRFSRLCRESDQAYLGALRSQLGFKVATDSVLAIGTATVLGLGGYHALTGKLSVGSLLVFATYLTSLYAPLETLAYLAQTFTSATAGARRIFDILDAGDRVHEDPAPVPLTRRREPRRVQFEGVAFAYEGARPVLRDIDLDVCPGETIALVGATGAGKSTLVSLIPRFYDPDRGRVLLDGVDIRKLALSDVRGEVAIVFQEPFLFPASITDNIAYGRPGASHEQIVAAAVAANADTFIRNLPQGYETVLGERGATLSGGERQRLSIARALLKDAPILILDEPTSALDAHTESLIMQALDRLIEGRTTFIIAHRLSTIRRADRIAVLDRGALVEIGTHAELLARGGAYSRLHRAQAPAETGRAVEAVR
jgi:ATP-binding cassette subfamily B protein